ncbi:MAG TPA: hypothetical protein VIG77_11145 [Ktedonobacterales bacterium]|jgi:chorismate synthase
MTRRSYAYLLAVLLMLVTTLVACGSTSSSGSPPSGSAKTTVCNGLTRVNQALDSLSNVNSSTTVGEVKAAQQKVTSALSAIESQIPAASRPLLDQLKSANDKLTAKLEGYPDNTPIGQTSVKVQDIKASVATAHSKTNSLISVLQCSS